MDEFVFRGDGLLGLAADLKAAAASLVVESGPTLTHIGEAVAETAKGIAYANGSKSIPPTIFGYLKPLEYHIQAGNESVPIAGLWELGNRGAPRDEPTFTHSVFGVGEVVQLKHPFLRPALRHNHGHIMAEMEAMWDRALRPWRLAPNTFI